MWNIANSSLLPGTGNVHCITMAREFKRVRLMPIDSVLDRIAIGCRTVKYPSNKRQQRDYRSKVKSDRQRVSENQKADGRLQGDW